HVVRALIEQHAEAVAQLRRPRGVRANEVACHVVAVPGDHEAESRVARDEVALRRIGHAVSVGADPGAGATAGVEADERLPDGCHAGDAGPDEVPRHHRPFRPPATVAWVEQVHAVGGVPGDDVALGLVGEAVAIRADPVVTDPAPELDAELTGHGYPT